MTKRNTDWGYQKEHRGYQKKHRGLRKGTLTEVDEKERWGYEKEHRGYKKEQQCYEKEQW